jgi:hypothetical protein
MPYILNKTDGSVLTVVQDASLDLTTNLTFVGRNYAGYGEIQNENSLKLLENFANSSAPTKPITGQLWFDTTSDRKKIKVYDGINWKSMANLEVNSSNPATLTTNAPPKSGDLWYNSLSSQLYVFDGQQYVLIGPSVGADTRAGWRGDFEISVEEGDGIPKYNTKAVIGLNNEVIAVVSQDTFTIKTDASTRPAFAGNYAKLYKGINLNGANSTTGESYQNGIYFWGTAAHSMVSEVAKSATGTSGVARSSVNQIHYLTFLDKQTGTSTNYTHFELTYNPGTRTLSAPFFTGIASSARFADLAERYSSDQPYESGTLVIIGGTAEITISTTRADTAVAGVISANPAYMMNAEAGDDLTHPYVALKGRVYCKVTGSIRKGERLVTSDLPGHAESWKSGDDSTAVFARALENFDGDTGLIEVKI